MWLFDIFGAQHLTGPVGGEQNGWREDCAMHLGLCANNAFHSLSDRVQYVIGRCTAYDIYLTRLVSVSYMFLSLPTRTTSRKSRFV